MKWEELPREAREKYLRGALLMSAGLWFEYTKPIPPPAGDDLEFCADVLERVEERWQRELERRQAAQAIAADARRRILRPTQAFEKGRKQ